MRKIFVAIPNLGEIRTGLHKTILRWVMDKDMRERYKLHFHHPEFLKPYQYARDNCVVKFFNSKADWEYLLFIDADIDPPFEMIDKLIEADKDIVGAAYPGIKENPDGCTVPLPMVFEERGDTLSLANGSGLEEVEALGTGAILIKKKVLEEMGPPWFNPKYDYEEPTLGVKQIDKTGEDVNFCLKAKELGFEIWADYSCVPKHRGGIEYKDFRDTLNFYIGGEE